MCHANNEKWKTTNDRRNRTTKSRKIRMPPKKEMYEYLGILEADTIKKVEMKEKIKKEYIRRTRKLLKTKVYSRNLIKRINTWAVLLVRYSGPFLKSTREELRQMEQRTRMLMMMHKALHLKDSICKEKKE